MARISDGLPDEEMTKLFCISGLDFCTWRSNGVTECGAMVSLVASSVLVNAFAVREDLTVTTRGAAEKFANVR